VNAAAFVWEKSSGPQIGDDSLIVHDRPHIDCTLVLQQRYIV
jgi:hypothetical protein